jgi:hypothetical protein
LKTRLRRRIESLVVPRPTRGTVFTLIACAVVSLVTLRIAGWGFSDWQYWVVSIPACLFSGILASSFDD